MAAEIVGGALLSSFATVLLEKCSTVIIEFFKGRKLNRELLKELQTKMESVQGVLDDAEEKQITQPAVRTWLDNLKDAFYEADDLLDEIAYAALSSKGEAGSQTSIADLGNLQHLLDQETGSKLKKILENLQYLHGRMRELRLEEGKREKRLYKKAETSSLMDESGVYGRQKDKEVIIQLLLSEDAKCNNLGLFPIVGMGGMGKTTLAQSVYNDSKVKVRFERKAWIYVSEEFDVLKVTRNILNGVSKKTTHDSNTMDTLDQLQLALKNELTDKKFLLVLDDVWNYDDEQWNILLRPLKDGAKGSKIIITTRLQNVTLLKEVIQTHHLEKLSNEECWLLFSTHAFGGKSPSEYPKLEEISWEIAEKCNGLPLAAKSLGGLLRSKRKLEEWERVLKSDIWSLREDKIIPALILSYLFLPSPLKQCFAYCAIFPKGHYFKKEELVLLWMGEGFLGQASSEYREVIGEEYFDDLVSRSFFNPDRERSFYHPDRDGFIMHDLISDLARYVAGEFCSILYDDDDSCKVLSKTRHLRYASTIDAPTENLTSNNSEVITASPLRTFLFNPRGFRDEKVNSDVIPKLERLRVLSFCGYAGMLKLDDSINNLKYLRYLDLSKQFIIVLPKSLCTLYHLEILLLVKCYGLKELPPKLGNLANLCVVDITGISLQKMPPHMGKLKKLQRLSDFVIGKGSESSIKELENLQQLRGRLVIRNLQNVTIVDEASSATKGKKYLKELELVWNGDVDNSEDARCLLERLEPHKNVETLKISGYGGTRFPYWMDGGSPLLVVTLELSGCKYCCQLPSLGQLEHLKSLSITDFPGIESIGLEFYVSCTSKKKPFQCLEVLRFKNMPQWREWVMRENEEEDFPLLQELYIIDCPVFEKSLPPYLPSLTRLEARGCKRLVASLPRVPRILNMGLPGLNLGGGNSLSVFRFQSPLIESIEQLSRGLFNALKVVSVRCDSLEFFPLEFSNLKNLTIECCPNFKTINGNNTSLLSLSIKDCPNFESFPEGGLKTPNLQSLVLSQCSNLKRLPESMHSLLLEKLVIIDCPELESFPEGSFPSTLQELEVDRCTKLIDGRKWWNLNHLPSLLDFKIKEYGHAECFPEESLLPPSLTSLEIWEFPNLKSLEYKGFQHLSSLQSLTVINCPKLQLFPEQGLPSSLTSLEILDLPNLESVVNNKIQQLTNLKELSIRRCPKLKSALEEGLPSSITSLKISNFLGESLNFEGLKSLKSLEYLEIVGCDQLQSLQGLQNLKSLKRLEISCCYELQSLPEEGLPSSLSSLYIRSCPILGKRCQQEKGEDWPKISHIPNIDIRS